MLYDRPLYHFTCDHGYYSLSRAGVALPACLLPLAQGIERHRMPWTGSMVWFTDLPNPEPLEVGLTSESLRCDRLSYRFRVTDDSGVTPWPLARLVLPKRLWDVLDHEGAQPEHWFVHDRGVPVTFDDDREARRVS